MLHLLLVLLFRYIWDFKKMRIFKNKITFFGIFSEACAAWGNEWVTQMTQMTQIFPSSYPQMRPIRSDSHRVSRLHSSLLVQRFFLPLRLSCKESSTS